MRSCKTATLLKMNGDFDDRDMAAVREFCKSRLIDISYHPGVKESETNIFNKFDEDIFYSAAIKLLSPAKSCCKHPFYVKPATDDRPFFSHFFKIDMMHPISQIIQPRPDTFPGLGIYSGMDSGMHSFPYGHDSDPSSHAFVLPSQKGLLPILVYFGSLGMAYMFLEISLLQQFIRYLYDPIFSSKCCDRLIPRLFRDRKLDCRKSQSVQIETHILVRSYNWHYRLHFRDF